MPSSEWISVKSQLPPEGVSVRTKIDNIDGVRNEQDLVRKGRLWFVDDHYSMYVYYTIPDLAGFKYLYFGALYKAR